MRLQQRWGFVQVVFAIVFSCGYFVVAFVLVWVCLCLVPYSLCLPTTYDIHKGHRGRTSTTLPLTTGKVFFLRRTFGSWRFNLMKFSMRTGTSTTTTEVLPCLSFPLHMSPAFDSVCVFVFASSFFVYAFVFVFLSLVFDFLSLQTDHQLFTSSL
jgi:hypothetical protein